MGDIFFKLLNMSITASMLIFAVMFVLVPTSLLGGIYPVL